MKIKELIEKANELANNITTGPWELDDPNDTLVAGRDKDDCYNYICEVNFLGNLSDEEEKSTSEFIALLNPENWKLIADHILRLEAFQKAATRCLKNNHEHKKHSSRACALKFVPIVEND